MGEIPDGLPDPESMRFDHLTDDQRLAVALWAFNKFLDAAPGVFEQGAGKKADPEAARVYGDILERATARAREGRA
ncbi:hypothetical protein [Actinomadura harenae]|uniref:Uncharacterized protein n=1 Tax=Actinomadura harenae TaxID=2483351 RepID=A0A3M2M540_9ACTN|nr:hypothetical protein [Actinomadura harenae]RMI44874.1 hypothetical protein EBO15_11355 [Actinomadura harenae]